MAPMLTKPIRIDEELWDYLKKRSTFEDTPNDVIRRELKLPMPSSTPLVAELPATSHRGGSVLKSDKEYSNLPISRCRYEGRDFPCRTFKEVLLRVCNDLRGRHGIKFDDFALSLHGKKRSYFLPTAAGLKHPRQLTGNGKAGRDLFVESNLSATAIMGLCQCLIRGMGGNVAEFTVR